MCFLVGGGMSIPGEYSWLIALVVAVAVLQACLLIYLLLPPVRRDPEPGSDPPRTAVMRSRLMLGLRVAVVVLPIAVALTPVAINVDWSDTVAPARPPGNAQGDHVLNAIDELKVQQSVLARQLAAEHRDILGATGDKPPDGNGQSDETLSAIEDLKRQQSEAASKLSQQVADQHGAILELVAHALNQAPPITPPVGQSSGQMLLAGGIALALVILLIAVFGVTGMGLARSLAATFPKWGLPISIGSILAPSLAGLLTLHLVKDFHFSLFKFKPSFDFSNEIKFDPELKFAPEIKFEPEINLGGGEAGIKDVVLDITPANLRLDCGKDDKLLIGTFTKKFSDKFDDPQPDGKIESMIRYLHENGGDRHLAALAVIGSADERAVNPPPTNEGLGRQRAEWVVRELREALRRQEFTIGMPRIIVVNAAADDARIASHEGGLQLMRAVRVCAIWAADQPTPPPDQ